MKILILVIGLMTLAACSTTPRYYIQEGGALQEVMPVEENDDMVILQKRGHVRHMRASCGVEMDSCHQHRTRVYEYEYEDCDHEYYEEERCSRHHDYEYLD